MTRNDQQSAPSQQAHASQLGRELEASPVMTLTDAEQALIQALNAWKTTIQGIATAGQTHSAIVAMRDHIRSDPFLISALGDI